MESFKPKIASALALSAAMAFSSAQAHADETQTGMVQEDQHERLKKDVENNVGREFRLKELPNPTALIRNQIAWQAEYLIAPRQKLNIQQVVRTEEVSTTAIRSATSVGASTVLNDENPDQQAIAPDKSEDDSGHTTPHEPKRHALKLGGNLAMGEHTSYGAEFSHGYSYPLISDRFFVSLNLPKVEVMSFHFETEHEGQETKNLTTKSTAAIGAGITLVPFKNFKNFEIEALLNGGGGVVGKATDKPFVMVEGEVEANLLLDDEHKWLLFAAVAQQRNIKAPFKTYEGSVKRKDVDETTVTLGGGRAF